MKTKKFSLTRRIKWLFFNSGIFSLAFEHFLAMFPATILVPISVNGRVGVTVIDMSLVLLTSGLGTIMFSLVSGQNEEISEGGIKRKRIKRIPAYLSSSFAYIGLTIYLLETQMGENVSAGMAYVYVGWSYMISGLILVLLSFLYKIRFIEKIFTKCLPAAVIGPAISLIGLELSDTAVVDSGLNAKDGRVDLAAVAVAMTTLCVIIFLSLIKRRRWKNSAIVIGMLVGYVVYIIINGAPTVDWDSIKFFTVPKVNMPFLTVPPNLPRLIVSVIPATLIVFAENIGRITVINRMQQEDGQDTQLFNNKSVKVMEKALVAHGVSSMIASGLGSVPNTIYAENIAVMGIHKSEDSCDEPDRFVRNLTKAYSVIPYWIAAAFAILASFSGHLQAVLMGIPKPVIGGMELFIFGIISAPGIQLLVDQRVNYKKISNQLITAAVLITGISELSIDFVWFELKGMSLGLVVGVLFNLIVLLLNRFGILCDPLSMGEAVSACIDSIPEDKENVSVEISKSLIAVEAISVGNLKKVLGGYDGVINAGKETQAEFLRDAVEHSSEIYIKTDKNCVRIIKKSNSISVDIRKELLPEDDVNIHLRDYREAVDTEKYPEIGSNKEPVDVEYLSINLARYIPLHRVQALIGAIKW